MIETRLYAWLAYLGAIPFLIAAIMISFGYPRLIFVGDLVYLVNSYGLVIVVFMSGIHWGQYLSNENAQELNLLLTSNFITLVAWFAFLLTTTILALVAYCISFSFLLAIDSKLASRRIISRHYFITRCIVTCIVLFSLLLTIFSLILRS